MKPVPGLIESGSHEPGVAIDRFGLPADTALRYERPDPRLAGLVSDYHVLDSIERVPDGAIDWMLPSWAAIRIILSERPIALRLGNRYYDPLPVASLYGVTSRAMRLETHGGVTVGVGLTPLGWARLFTQRADAFRDRITPLDQLLPPAQVAALVTRLRASDRSRDVKAILDAALLPLMPRPHPDEPMIARIMAMLLDDRRRDLNGAAEELGVTDDRLRNVTNRYFGFPPKTLLLRSRFLRHFVHMLVNGDASDLTHIAPAYHDASHFLRDARRFLGMTPRAFMAMDTPYLKAALRARAIVFGQPTATLRAAGINRPEA
ncbi:MAG: helix-turn-helix domain-containing protein [Pseudomonadota bacterium]